MLCLIIKCRIKKICNSKDEKKTLWTGQKKSNLGLLLFYFSNKWTSSFRAQCNQTQEKT